MHQKNILISIDETCDTGARYVANIRIGTLETDGTGEAFLFTSDMLELVNYYTICKLFNSSVFLLWQQGAQRDDFILFVTDAAPIRFKRRHSIKSSCSRLVHIIYLAHELHRVTEEVIRKFPHVHALVSRTKKNFVNAPARKMQFKPVAPGISLTPEHTILRCETWIDGIVRL